MRIHVKPTMECNLACFYCCEKREEGRMSDATVADIVARVGEAVDREGAGVVKFDWSGGEPLLMGVEFYCRAFGLQRDLIPGRIDNAVFTNLLPLDRPMADLLGEVSADVYTSLDDLDANRLRSGSRLPCAEQFDERLALVLERGIATTLYMTVTRYNVDSISDVYRYAAGRGVSFDFPNVQLPFIDGDDRLARIAPDAARFAENAVELFDAWYLSGARVADIKPFRAVIDFLLSGGRPRPAALPTFDHLGARYACPLDISGASSPQEDVSAPGLARLAARACHNTSLEHPACADCAFVHFCHWMLCREQAVESAADVQAAFGRTCAYWKPVFEHIRTRMVSDLETAAQATPQPAGTAAGTEEWGFGSMVQ